MGKSEVGWDIIVIVVCSVCGLIIVLIALRKLQLRHQKHLVEINGSPTRSRAQIEAESRARNFRFRAQQSRQKLETEISPSPSSKKSAIRQASEVESKVKQEQKVEEGKHPKLMEEGMLKV